MLDYLALCNVAMLVCVGVFCSVLCGPVSARRHVLLLSKHLLHVLVPRQCQRGQLW